MTDPHTTQQAFPFCVDWVFDAVVAACEANGLKVKSRDWSLRRITAAAGVTLTSWGEELLFVLEEESDERTIVRASALARVRTNVGSAARQVQHIEDVFGAMKWQLERRAQRHARAAEREPERPTPRAASAIPPSWTAPKSNDLLVLVVLLAVAAIGVALVFLLG